MMKKKSLFQRLQQAVVQKRHNISLRATQDTLNFDKMFENGVVQIDEDTFSQSLRFSDVGYQLSRDEEKTRIFSMYCQLLNWFDPDIHFQFSFINQKMYEEAYQEFSAIDTNDEKLQTLKREYFEFIETQREKGNNGIVRNKYLTVTIKEKNYKNATRRLQGIIGNVSDLFRRLGAVTYALDGVERLAVLNTLLNNREPNYFDVKFLGNEVFEEGLEKDYIAPRVLDFSQKDTSFRLGKRKGATLYFDITSSELTDRVLADFLELQKELVVSIHVQGMQQQDAIKMMKSKSSDLDAIKIKEQQKAIQRGYDMDLMPTDLDPNRADVTKLLEKLQSDDERYFYVTVTVTCFDETDDELLDTIHQLKALAQKYNCELLDLKNQQEKAFLSALPLGNNINEDEYERGLNTTATAIFIPFTTQELYQEENNPIYYGLNALSNNLVQVSRKSLRNPNGLFLGTPGSGKSFSAKREMIDTFLSTTDDIIITDPEGEYGDFVRQLQGHEVIISLDSNNHINPLDINEAYGDTHGDPVMYKSDFIINMMNIIVGTKDGLNGKQKSLTDKAVRQIYLPYLDSKGSKEKIPVLEDLFNAFREMQDEQPEARDLADSLELYVHGSLDVFNNETTVNIDNRIVSFNIQHLGSNLRDLGMLILQDYVWNIVTDNKNKNKTTWYYMDEFHVLLADERTSGYSVDFWKRFRKYGGIPTGITQNVNDLLTSQKIETILDNSDFIYLLNQATADRIELQNRLTISDYQAQYITNSEEGEGLIVYNGEVLPFKDKFPKNNSLYPVMTTKPEEIAEYRERNLLPEEE